MDTRHHALEQVCQALKVQINDTHFCCHVYTYVVHVHYSNQNDKLIRMLDKNM